eukprot:jgi/Mesvir1/14753/Mv05396-RA.1
MAAFSAAVSRGPLPVAASLVHARSRPCQLNARGIPAVAGLRKLPSQAGLPRRAGKGKSNHVSHLLITRAQSVEVNEKGPIVQGEFTPSADDGFEMTMEDLETGKKVNGAKVESNLKAKATEVPKQTPKKKADLVVAEAAGGRWNRFKKYSVLQRTFEIWSFVVKFFWKRWVLSQAWSYKKDQLDANKAPKKEAQSTRRRELAAWVKENLLRLGPTFIKIGQQFSTRQDLLEKEYTEELSELQDNVPAFGGDVAVQILEQELGKPVDQLFERFDREPIAAASLGQVHRARLNGEEVVVKVQRAGLKELFDIDLKNLRVLAVNLQKFDPKTDGAARDWVAIYDECARCLYDEIDYRQEGRNADTFRANFASADWVLVPSVFWDYTTERVLTMQYMPGVKITNIDALDALGIEKDLLAKRVVESYLQQILVHGFFHADPHPGNLAVDDQNGGRIIYYDFGMMGSISNNISQGLQEAFYALYEKDADKVLDAMVKMGVLVPGKDMISVRRTAQFFLNQFEERLKAQKEERKAAEAEGRKLTGYKPKESKEDSANKRKARLASIGEDLLAISVDQPFRFPATFTFVVRSFSVLDGIGKTLNQRFDITEIARPYVREVLDLDRMGGEMLVREAKKRFGLQNRAVANLFRAPDRMERIEGVLARLESGELKLRVRTLEGERALKRVAVMQDVTVAAVLSTLFGNLAAFLRGQAQAQAGATVAAVLAGFCCLQMLAGIAKVKKMDKQEKVITGVAT